VPEFINIEKGSNFTLSCESDDYARWYFTNNDETPTSPPIEFTEEFIVPIASHLLHSGFYYCYGKLEHEENNFLSRAEVRVYGK